MQSRDNDLHGMVPDRSNAALLLLDVINDLEWPGGELLLEHLRPVAPRLVAMKREAKAHGIPAIYVNDNYGRWQSDLHHLVEHCLRDGARGRETTELLRPDADDYFVLKPKHSGFFSTSLEVLLAHLGARTLILTGVAGNICVFFTANDAHMRDFELVVPSDCVASNDPSENDHALQQMQTVLGADITPSPRLDLAALSRGESREQVARHG